MKGKICKNLKQRIKIDYCQVTVCGYPCILSVTCTCMFTMFTHVIVAIDIYFIYKSKIVIEVVGIQFGCHTLESIHDWDTCQKINRKYKCITVF